MSSPPTLTSDNLSSYLSARGVLADTDEVRVHELPGGVSGVTLLVDTGQERVVVKQALPLLRVADEWRSDPARTEVEARAMGTLGRVTPGSAPGLLDVDPARHVVTMTAAPQGTRTWRDDLLAARVDVAVASRVGEVLGRWHTATVGDPVTSSLFEDRTTFQELRVAPFYEAVMAVRPALAPAVERWLDSMFAVRKTIVHGDYSPKNVLMLPQGGVWIVDFEVAHWGDPTFDLAFLLHHLLLKAIHLPHASSALLSCGEAFLEAYEDLGPSHLVTSSRTLGHVGCLLLARVLGWSPAPYLTAEDKAQAETLGCRLVNEPPATLAQAWPAPGGSRS